jgi:hypothetical protein
MDLLGAVPSMLNRMVKEYRATSHRKIETAADMPPGSNPWTAKLTVPVPKTSHRRKLQIPSG